MADIRELSQDDLYSEVKNDDYTLVDFFAPWCGPCTILSGRLAEYSNMETAIPIIKVNVDENPDITKEFDVSTIPQLFLVDSSGEVIANLRGILTPANLDKWVQEHTTQ